VEKVCLGNQKAELQSPSYYLIDSVTLESRFMSPALSYFLMKQGSFCACLFQNSNPSNLFHDLALFYLIHTFVLIMPLSSGTSLSVYKQV
jgi:hypothetical protein